MRFSTFYFTERYNVDDTVYMYNDDTEYIIRSLGGNGMVELVHAKNKHKDKQVHVSELTYEQPMLPGIDIKRSSKPTPKKKFKRVKKMGKAQDVKQTSLF